MPATQALVVMLKAMLRLLLCMACSSYSGTNPAGMFAGRQGRQQGCGMWPGRGP